MRSLATILTAVALVALWPAALAATITCTPSGDNPITVTVSSDNLIILAGQPVESNATVSLDTCMLGQGLPNTSCTWSATIDSPGPGSVEISAVDLDLNPTTCGPFTNEDGLPVELIGFSVE